MQVNQVTDPQALKAIAHPLRLRLLGSLRMDGPQTASELGRRFDESSGSTSYHLRVLAKHGFITEDADQPNARDKRWRARHAYTKWNDADFDDPVGSAAAQVMRDHQLDMWSMPVGGSTPNATPGDRTGPPPPATPTTRYAFRRNDYDGCATGSSNSSRRSAPPTPVTPTPRWRGST